MPSRRADYIIEGRLTTEVYNPESHSWRKPRRKTLIELFETRDAEEPFIYEMGIPVAAAEWAVPYHANVLQRVPMNPNRDALASGYATRIHKACLPTLLAEMSDEDARKAICALDSTDFRGRVLRVNETRSGDDVRGGDARSARRTRPAKRTNRLS